MHAHPHSHQKTGIAPRTEGRTIRWSRYYDLLVKLMTFGTDTAMRRETIRLAALPSEAAVLDVGCGTGSLTLLAKQEVARGRVYGIDAAPEMIAVARQKAARQKRDVDFQVGLIESIPFPDSMFDVVLSSLMFHHLPGDLKHRGLSEIYRVLKPGGRLLIVDVKRPDGGSHRLDMIMLAHHGMRDGVEDLMPLVEHAGFRDVRTGSMKMRSIGYVAAQRP